MVIALSAMACHHDQPKTPELYNYQVPPMPTTNEQKAEAAGAYVAGKTYRAGEATYEYLTSEKMKERARRVKAYAKEKAREGLDATKELLDEELKTKA